MVKIQFSDLRHRSFQNEQMGCGIRFGALVASRWIAWSTPPRGQAGQSRRRRPRRRSSVRRDGVAAAGALRQPTPHRPTSRLFKGNVRDQRHGNSCAHEDREIPELLCVCGPHPACPSHSKLSARGLMKEVQSITSFASQYESRQRMEPREPMAANGERIDQCCERKIEKPIVLNEDTVS